MGGGWADEKSLLLSDIYETQKASAGLPVAPESAAIRMFRLMLAERPGYLSLRIIPDHLDNVCAFRLGFSISS